MALKTVLETEHHQVKVICIGSGIQIHIIDLKSKSENITRVSCDKEIMARFLSFLDKIRIIGFQLGNGRFQQSHSLRSKPNEVVTERVSATGRIDTDGTTMSYRFTYRSTLVDKDTKKTIYESRCVVEFPFEKAKDMAVALRNELLECCRPKKRKKK